jgi:peroxiredoxin Q/BCP
MNIDEGDTAPDFTLPTDGGGDVSLQALRGKPVVLYFYPKDSTPGCTTEACDFRDAMPDLSGLNTAVVGISKDSVKRHDNFKAKHTLPFTLGSDANGDVCECYGVWKEKKLYGRVFMGIERTTFLIDGEGVVRNVWRKVRVPGHVAQVLEAAKAL